jgi:hypothetical protein
MGSAGHTIEKEYTQVLSGSFGVRSLFMAITALRWSLSHLLMASFAGIVSPILAKTCNLSTLGSLMTGDTSLFLLDHHMFRVRKIYITILGRQADCVAA